MQRYRTGVTQARLKEVLKYDRKSGIFTWRVYKGPSARLGSIAGTLHTKGYRYIWIDGVAYRASRLAWLYVTGEWPSSEIDHRDCRRDNDSYKNLRLASRQQNTSNCTVRRTNKLGIKGVSINHRAPNKPYLAQIQVDKKKIWLGNYRTCAEAHDIYSLASELVHGDFGRAA